MPKIAYMTKSISEDRLELIRKCNQIIKEYQADGLLLTLRQLYYQLVSRDFIANTIQSYKRVGDVINDARLAGLMDWDAIEDRTRELVVANHWSSPSDILSACASQFRTDRWANQDTHPEVWIEKEALSGVFERICRSMDVGCFACRGYTSQSEMWGAAQRFVRHIRNGKNVVILHFGDHDPSGIDMTRDIEDRIRMFARHHVGTKADSMIEIRRLALNMDQVNLYNPPENPAKVTDSRFASYEAVYGDKSWELDALNPRTLTKLVRDNVMAVADRSLWDDIIQTEAEARGQLATLHAEYSNVIARIEDDVELNDTMNDRINDAKDDILTEMGVGSEGDDDETGDDSDGGEDE